MTRTLIVATEVQKVIFTKVLLAEIATGFWKNARPSDHADSWKDVSVTVGSELGPIGFDIPRNYNFVNPDFFRKAEEQLMTVAKTINVNITVKQLKKQLLSLNQILGSRLKEINGEVIKLPRGRKQSSDGVVKTTVAAKNKTTVRKAVAVVIDSDEMKTTEAA